MGASAKIIGLTRYRKKGEPGEPLSEMNFLEGFGIERNLHQGGERQVCLLLAEARLWMEAQTEQAKIGLCFGRFRENILIEGLPLEDLESGSLLYIGNAVLRISTHSKHCYDECNLFSKRMTCRLSGGAAFAVVERSGKASIGDSVRFDKTI